MYFLSDLISELKRASPTPSQIIRSLPPIPMLSFPYKPKAGIEAQMYVLNNASE